MHNECPCHAFSVLVRGKCKMLMCPQTNDVEVKWGIHKKGEENGGFATNRHAKTMSVLVEGAFQLTFKKEDGTQENIKLTRPGDFALWDFGVPHNWAVLEDSVVLTVRWPSIPKDQTI